MANKAPDGSFHVLTAQTGATDSGWWAPYRASSAQRKGATLTCVISMTAGTGTWILEGRRSPNGAAVQIDTGTASKLVSAPRFNEFRLRWTAAAGLTARASFNVAMKNLTYTPNAVGFGVRVDGNKWGSSLADAVNAVVSQIGSSRIDAFACPAFAAPTLDGSLRVSTVPDVRGAGSWQLFSGGTQLALTGSSNPAYDAASGTITTDNTSTLALAASATNSIRGQDKWVVVIGALNPNNAESCLGWINASDFSKYASIQGDANTMMAFLSYQSGGTQSVFSGQNASTSMGMMIFEHPQPIGVDTARALYIPRVQVEWYGRAARRLQVAQGGTYVLPTAGNYFVHCGGRFFGVGSNGANTQVRAIISGSGYLTAADKYALYKLALQLNVNCVAPRPITLFTFGDSRPYGVGVTDIATKSITARLQNYFGTTVDVVSHGIPGMWMQEMAQQAALLLQAQASPIRKSYALIHAGINDMQVSGGVRSPAQCGDDGEVVAAALEAAGIKPILCGELFPLVQASRDTYYARQQATATRLGRWLFKPDTRVAFQSNTAEYLDSLHLNDTGADHFALDLFNFVQGLGGLV